MKSENILLYKLDRGLKHAKTPNNDHNQVNNKNLLIILRMLIIQYINLRI